MNPRQEHSQRFDQVHELVTKLLEGTATEAEQQQLQEAVINDCEVRLEYIRYIQEVSHIASRLVPPQTTDIHSKAMVLEAFKISEDAPFNHATSPSIAGAHRPKLPYSWIGTAAVTAAILLVILSFQLGVGRVDLDPSKTESIAHSTQSHPHDSQAPDHGKEVATLLQGTNVIWDSLHRSVEDLHRISIGQTLCIHEGSLKLVFDTGVEALVLAPCLIEIQDRDRVYCSYGRIAAKANDSGIGFMIDTPVARVTDLGTEFGVSISDSGDTEVAVFKGKVNVGPNPTLQQNKNATPVRGQRLVQGQATLVGRDGQSRRVFSIDNQRLPGVRDLAPLHLNSPVISEVRDNIGDRHPENRMFYRIVQAGLREDSQAFVDRNHEWNGLSEDGMPAELIGADYVMPFNDDKFADNLVVRVAIARPATVYIFFCDNTPAPDWLTTRFEDTGLDLGLDEVAGRYHSDRKLSVGPAQSIDNTFSIWKRTVDQPQELVLGSFERPADVQLGYNMYGIAAVAR
ncbi:FecR protein [Novipirellula aureliae]|uniref:FecR protein n=1 Tax=Novipirellula aureliae TaxID=2527966 RepID=A0A5C6DQ04_9BACT|nr:FecR domain-containing protein [Novipirellula aureliae]TWU38828.1 FecR protein [Novipirellula aureliae]